MCGGRVHSGKERLGEVEDEWGGGEGKLVRGDSPGGRKGEGRTLKGCGRAEEH